MARYLHYAHLLPKSWNVEIGKVYQGGRIIARVGKSGTNAAHLHFESRKDLIGGYNFYPYWKMAAWVRAHYENPLEYFAKPGIAKPMVFDHFGYNFLSKVNWYTYHPGVDLNRGGGDTDLGDPVYLTERSKCIAILPGSSANSYGNHLYFETMPGGAISDEEIKNLYRTIWKREPAYGDWFYFRRRIQLGTIQNTQSDVKEKVEFTYGKFKELGDGWWQDEKKKVLG